MKESSGFNTKLIHAGAQEDSFGSVAVPIYQTSTFAFKNAAQGAARFAGEEPGYIYTRLGNPTVRALEENVASLENGFGAVATASGMGAVSTLYTAYLKQGAHIVCSEVVYGPSRGILENIYSKFGVEATFVDSTDIAQVEAAIKANTVMLYVETPANPTMGITDLAACGALAKKHHLVFVVDNTFLSPYLQSPFDFGADIVLHSLTKFINGHADIVGGMLVAKTEEHYKKMLGTMTMMGPNMDPHQAFLALRGVRTLSIRMDRGQENCQKVAEWLEQHQKVAWVRYPGLKSHPQYELAQKQQRGPGAMLSFGLKGGLEAGRSLMDKVKLAGLAVSLGGVETLIQHPATMTHSKMSQAAKLKGGITDDLVRLSVGIEDVEDIIADLEQGMA